MGLIITKSGDADIVNAEQGPALLLEKTGELNKLNQAISRGLQASQ